MSKFKRRSPEAVRNAVNFKYKIMNIAWLKRHIQEEEEANKKHEERIMLLKGRVDGEQKTTRIKESNNNDISNKFLYLASTLIASSIILLVGVISNAP